MKKVLVRIFSVILILACLAALGVGGINIRYILDTKEYWEDVRAEALESFDTADDGIAQLSENEQTYVDGVDTLEEGKKSLAAGEKKLGVNQPVYDANANKLEDAHAQYNEKYAQYQQGLKDLEAGKAELAAGEKMLAENRQAYEDGKAKLARVEPIYKMCMGHYNAYVNAQAKYDQLVADGKTVEAALYKPTVDAMKFTYENSLGGMSMQSIIADYNAGKAQIAAYEEGMKVAEAGRQKIAASEKMLADAQKALAAAKGQLDANDKKLSEAGEQLKEGYKSLGKGQEQLEEGLAQLSVFEGGQDQIAAGLDTIIGTPTYFDENDEPIVESIAERLGEDFNYYKLDENGEILILNEQKAVDLEKASQVILAGREFVEDTTDAVTNEVMGRVVSTLIIMVAAVFGLIAGIFGLCAKGSVAGVLAVITAIAAAAALAAAYAMGGVAYPLSELAEAGNAAIIIAPMYVLLAAALLACVFGFIAGNTKKEGKAAVEAPVDTQVESEALQIARAEADKAKAEAEKFKAEAEIAKAEAEKLKAELEVLKMNAAKTEEPAIV